MNQTLYYHVAIWTVLAIVMAFILKARPFGRRKPAIDDLWSAEGYHAYLLRVIDKSKDMLDLEVAMEMIDATWYTKTFRDPIGRFKRNRMYIELCDAFVKKEETLTKVSVTLCAN